jgi:hypothetical protein
LHPATFWGRRLLKAINWTSSFATFFFKTRHGRTYRILFLLADQEVRVLRVRGPGQRPVSKRDIPANE